MYIITDDKLTPLETLLESVTKTINGGSAIIQPRDKTGSDETIEKTSLMLQKIMPYIWSFVCLKNDKIDIAIKF